MDSKWFQKEDVHAEKLRLEFIIIILYINFNRLYISNRIR